MHSKNLITAGLKLKEATKALIMLHGRGNPAEDILSIAAYLHVKEFALIAPQASENSWYPYSFLVNPSENEPWLTSALGLLKNIVTDVTKAGIAPKDIYFIGFSQGACLALEYATRNAQRFGGIAALSGGLIGDKIYTENYKGDFKKTPVFIGSSNPDPHIPVERVTASAEELKKLNASMNLQIYPGLGHTICQDELDQINKLIFGKK